MAIAPLLKVQNNFNDANAADDATKWTRPVESALLGITDLEAQTASSIATQGEWYKAVYERFVAVLSPTPLSGELSAIFAELKSINMYANRECQMRKLRNANGLANSGTNPHWVNILVTPLPWTLAAPEEGVISPPTSDYNASSSSLAGSDRSVNSQYQPWLHLLKDNAFVSGKAAAPLSPTFMRALRQIPRQDGLAAATVAVVLEKFPQTMRPDECAVYAFP
ncbi:hypothetical protein EV421DRAFT_2038350 [Armillaria borealis]|uniref:Uncharacterized protein n=1 Tax=Armillaria borealis TaxID=47425 RepID=A0AA39J7N4_9AGAR|nr:hypothetical protein EV421DRAFT_2041710 [Armillaria borealis]KAK0437189.1 hypothetical protein EV421DRAFT_2038350 [Armillaria borealis]